MVATAQDISASTTPPLRSKEIEFLTCRYCGKTYLHRKGEPEPLACSPSCLTTLDSEQFPETN